MKSTIISMCAAALLQGCSVAQPDFTPIGDGLKAIGISLVVYGALKALVRLIKADDRKSNAQPGAEPHQTRTGPQSERGEE